MHANTAWYRPIRHAYVEPFGAPIRFGVYGAIRQFYGVEPDEEIPATGTKALGNNAPAVEC